MAVLVVAIGAHLPACPDPGKDRHRRRVVYWSQFHPPWLASRTSLTGVFWTTATQQCQS